MKRYFFHVKYLFVVLLASLSLQAFAQGSIRMEDKVLIYNLPEDTALVNLLTAKGDYKKLPVYDQQIAYYLNYARRNPAVFLQQAINTFVTGHPEIKSSYIGTLQATFKSLQPLSVIYPDLTISKIALAHATDLRTHKVISHTSTNGTSFQNRVSSVLKGCGSESIHASMRPNALEAVLSLLFDFNVPDLGHRKSLLDKRFTKAGYGSSIVANNYSVTVIDFSCQ